MLLFTYSIINAYKPLFACNLIINVFTLPRSKTACIKPQNARKRHTKTKTIDKVTEPSDRQRATPGRVQPAPTFSARF